MLGNLKWVRTYYAQIASPLTPVDVAGGHFLFVTFRLLQGSVAFLLVMVLFGATVVVDGRAGHPRRGARPGSPSPPP